MRPKSRELLKKANISALLITGEANMRYLAGWGAQGAVLAVRQNGCSLFVSALEIDSAADAVRTGIRVRPLETLWGSLQGVKNCRFEAEDISVARLKRWKKAAPKVAFNPVSGLVEEYRRSKEEDELTAIIEANRITEDILARIQLQLKPGITERDLAWKIESRARAMGAEKLSFETIVAFGSHTSRPHHRPTDRVLKKGDMVQIDMGVVIDGYCSDRSMVYFTAKPTAKERKVYEALEEAKNAAIDVIAPGVACSEPDRIARDILKKHGLEQYFIHSLGHGVGLEIHEGVSLSQKSTDAFLEHEVVTVEPGIYIPGKFGMRLEDMVIVE